MIKCGIGGELFVRRCGHKSKQRCGEGFPRESSDIQLTFLRVDSLVSKAGIRRGVAASILCFPDWCQTCGTLLFVRKQRILPMSI